MLFGIDCWWWRALSNTSPFGFQLGFDLVIVKAKAWYILFWSSWNHSVPPCASYISIYICYVSTLIYSVFPFNLPLVSRSHLLDDSFLIMCPIWTEMPYVRLETCYCTENHFVLRLLCQADKTRRFTVNWFLHSRCSIMVSFRGNVLSLNIFEEQCLKPLEHFSTKQPQKGITDQIFIMLTDALCSLLWWSTPHRKHKGKVFLLVFLWLFEKFIEMWLFPS